MGTAALLNLLPFSQISIMGLFDKEQYSYQVSLTWDIVHPQNNARVSEAGDAGTETIVQQTYVEILHWKKKY